MNQVEMIVQWSKNRFILQTGKKFNKESYKLKSQNKLKFYKNINRKLYFISTKTNRNIYIESAESISFIQL